MTNAASQEQVKTLEQLQADRLTSLATSIFDAYGAEAASADGSGVREVVSPRDTDTILTETTNTDGSRSFTLKRKVLSPANGLDTDESTKWDESSPSLDIIFKNPGDWNRSGSGIDNEALSYTIWNLEKAFPITEKLAEKPKNWLFRFMGRLGLES